MDDIRCRDCPTSWQIVISNGTIQPRVYCYLKVDSYVNWNESGSSCSTAATSYFGTASHLIYIDDFQELQNVSTGYAKISGTLKNGFPKFYISFELNFIYMVSVFIR